MSVGTGANYPAMELIGPLLPEVVNIECLPHSFIEENLGRNIFKENVLRQYNERSQLLDPIIDVKRLKETQSEKRKVHQLISKDVLKFR